MYQTLAELIEVQEAIQELRRLAGSGSFDAETSSLLQKLADEIEACARKFDAER